MNDTEKNMALGIINQAGCMIVGLNMAGRITFINDYGARFCGLPPSALVGKPFAGHIVFNADSSETGMNRLFERMLQNSADQASLPLNTVSQDKGRPPVEWHFSPHRNLQNQMVGIFALGIPLSGPLAMETGDASPVDKAAFVLTSDNYRYIFEKSMALNFVVDFKGQILLVNEAVAKATGYDKEELYGKTVFDLTPPEEHELVSGQVTLMRAHAQSSESATKPFKLFTGIKIKVLTKAGGLITILYSNNRQIIEDGQGRPVAFYVAGIDITELEAATEALRVSETRFRYFFEKSPTLNWIFRFDGTIVAVNEAAAEIFNAKAADLIHTNYLKLFPPEERERRRKRIEGVHRISLEHPGKPFLTIGAKDHITRMTTPRGLRSFLVPKELSVMHENDKPVGFMVSVMDVTELENAREELQRRRDYLEVLVRERTRELEAAQAELVRKERLAALGRLTATVSHELRNPLGTVNNALYIIGKRTGDQVPIMQAALNRARRNIRRCDEIIEELLNHTRERAFRTEAVHIDPWLASLMDEQAVPEGISLERHLACDAMVSLDRELFRRCLINILSNAFQALETLPHNRQVHVETQQIDGRVEIRVRDNGCGIDASQIQRIFDPLYSTKSYGVGLGLPIAQKIAVQHGGDLLIQSTPGMGTTVTVTLPLFAG